MQQPKVNQRLIVIIASVIILLIFIGGFLLFQSSKKTTPPISKQEQAIRDRNNGQGPETFGHNPNTPAILNTESLLTHGITPDQLGAMDEALTTYATSVKPMITQISILTYTIHIGYHDPNSSSDLNNANFTAQFSNGKTAYAVINYTSGGNQLQLILSDTAQASPYFDSGLLTHSIK